MLYGHQTVGVYSLGIAEGYHHFKPHMIILQESVYSVGESGAVVTELYNNKEDPCSSSHSVLKITAPLPPSITYFAGPLLGYNGTRNIMYASLSSLGEKRNTNVVNKKSKEQPFEPVKIVTDRSCLMANYLPVKAVIPCILTQE